MTQGQSNNDSTGLPDDLDQQLRRLFEGLGRWEDFDPHDPPTDGYIILGGGEDTILIQSEALIAYQQLVFDLTQSAFESGGYQAEAVRTILSSACGRARHDGTDDAIQHVRSALEQQASQWTIIGKLSGHVRNREFTIGQCEITNNLEPSEYFSDYGDWNQPPFIKTTLMARDQESAQMIATERFEEAEAILGLTDLNRSRPSRPAIARGGDDAGGDRLHSGRMSRFFAGLGVNEPHPDYPPLIPEYQALSDAAALPYEDRPDWPKRVIAAARWMKRALDTTWQAEALVAAMSAMESIMVRDWTQARKGPVIAERLTDIVLLRGFDRAEQIDWIEELYRSRNAVVHEGASLTQDLDILRFAELSKIGIRRAVHHLSPFHRIPNKACRTFDDVFDAEAHSDSLRELHAEEE